MASAILIQEPPRLGLGNRGFAPSSLGMIHMESGQSKAAILMNAARRSHFVARIQKYEAKVKQEQKRRALQREKQEIAMTLIEQQSISWQSPESPLLPKVQVTMEFITAPPNQQGEGVAGFIDIDRNNTERGTGFIDIDGKNFVKGMSTLIIDSSPKGTYEGPRDRAMIVSGLAPTETKPTQDCNTYITLKPAAALHVDISAVAAALEVKIKNVDMAGMMQEHAFRCASECLKTTEKHMSKQTAYILKKEFDRAYGPAWHCIVGRSFGSYVTHSVGGFVYFSMGKISVLLFKTSVELVEHW